MTIERVRQQLRSDASCVLVKSAAGCGKTYEAALYASEVGGTLAEGQTVLLLAHTNAAVQECSRRLRGLGGRAKVSTIDSFCLELASMYASPLGLPNPLLRHIGVGNNQIRFEELSRKANELVSRSPTVARLLGLKYPVIILDEHQDARVVQHSVIKRIAEAGQSRLRIFGDPMQAIYQMDATEIIPWGTLEAEAQVSVTLDTPQRWRAVPELGEWVLRQREALEQGGQIRLRDAPQCVVVTRVPGMGDVRFGKGNPRHLSGPLRAFLDRANGSVAVVSFQKKAVDGLQSCARDRLQVNEGSDCEEEAYAILTSASELAENARRLAWVLIDALKERATGLDQQKVDALARILGDDRIVLGRNRILAEFVNKFELLYQTPNLASFCEVISRVLHDPPQWVRVKLPEAFRLLARIRPQGEQDPFEALSSAIMVRKIAAKKIRRSVGTIHKAKGLEYDHVLIAHLSASHFPDNDFGRRLAYVAMTRATQSLELLVPETDSSPLLDGN